MEEQTISFCKYYKPFLVEDLSFNEKRDKLHYGKCSVIGFCVFNRGSYYLGNIRITSLSSDAQLPDDSIRVLLLTHLCSEPPPIDKFVVIFGEVVLYDTALPFTDDFLSSNCINVKDLLKMRERKNYERKGGNIDNFDLVSMQRFRPAIKVHCFKVIDNAHELINYNLRLKKIIKKS